MSNLIKTNKYNRLNGGFFANYRQSIFPGIFSLLVILVSACAPNGGLAAQNGSLTASGTISALEARVSSEAGGVVQEVLVQEGASVEPGDELVRLDDEMLQAQRQRGVIALEAAEATLSTAQVGLEMAQAALRTAELSAEAASAKSKAELIPLKQKLQDLYDDHEVVKSNTEGQVAAANRAVREAQYTLDNFTVPVNQKNMTTLEAISTMKERLDQAREKFEPYKYASSNDPTREDLKEAMDEAQSDYDAALKRMEYETALKKAQAALESEMENLQSLMDGPDPNDVSTLEASIEAIEKSKQQAEAAVDQSKIGVAQAEAALNQAKKSVALVQAELDLIDLQIKKLVLRAPIAGVILSRNIEPGEMLVPGSPKLVIGQLQNVELTVYIPEDKYGQVHLEDQVSVKVDSFPGEAFQGEVIYISDRAEFTPRNVQTEEGRRSTVYAIKILIPNPDDKLKPGMPAEVTFLE